jgi:hypothetical protein
MFRHISRPLAAVVAAGVAVAALSVPVLAASKQPGYIDDTVDCFDLLFNNPAAHASQCAGVTPTPGGSTLAPTQGGNPPAPDLPCLLVDLKFKLDHAGERVRVAGLPCIPCVIGGGGGGALGIELPAIGERARVAVIPCPVDR